MLGGETFPLHLFLSLTAHSLHLPCCQWKGTSSAVTKIASSSPCFDKWPAFLFQNTKSLSYHHKAGAIKGNNCIGSREKRFYKFSLQSCIGPEALHWFYAKEQNNSGKQKWNGESETERGWRGAKQTEPVLESWEVQMRYSQTDRVRDH